MKKVLIVDDSVVAREFLSYIIGSDPELEVVGTASNGEEAIEANARLEPDIITMDIHMSSMDGLEATRHIMETRPIPIIIVSASSTIKEVSIAFHCLDTGALAVLPRPKGIGDPEYKKMAEDLVQTIKLMSEVKVVRRWRKKDSPIAPKTITTARSASTKIKVVAIGSSTGGPVVVKSILEAMPKGFPVPILIVQHMAAGFISGFADWLGKSSALPIFVPANNDNLLPGHVYLAPDNCHMGVTIQNRILLCDDKPENSLRPSASYLFRSVSQVFGENAAGVLLTGMGTDGAKELKLLKDRGAITLVQDKESSLVHGMPGEAIKLGAATYVLPPEGIAATLLDLIKN